MSKAIKIAKLGKNALTATDPNDFIFNSDLNTFCILDTKTSTPSLGTSAAETFVNVAHGKGWTPFMIPFCKFEDNSVSMPGSAVIDTQTYPDFIFTNFRVDATNAGFGYINNTGSNYSPVYKGFIADLPITGTPTVSLPTSKVIRIAKSGYNATTDTNQDHIIFDSRYRTLKYFSNGTTSIQADTSTPGATVAHVYSEVITTHNLGYYPFFTYSIGFDDYPNVYYPGAFNFSDAGFWGYDFVYCTTTQLIFKTFRGNEFGGIEMGGQALNIYWKIYSFDLGL